MRLEESKERLAVTGVRLREERMRHLSAGRTLDRNSSSRIARARAQATALFKHGRIKATITKAENLQPFVEKLITTARRGDAVQEAFIELVKDEG